MSTLLSKIITPTVVNMADMKGASAITTASLPNNAVRSVLFIVVSVSDVLRGSNSRDTVSLQTLLLSNCFARHQRTQNCFGRFVKYIFCETRAYLRISGHPAPNTSLNDYASH